MTSIPAILATRDLLAYVPQSAELRSVGRDRWRGRCAVGDHCRGGFAVWRAREGHLLWHCFGCNAGGDVIDLVSLLDGCSKGEALRKLDTGEALSVDARLVAAFDLWQRSSGLFLLVCSGCGMTKWLDSWLEVALVRANATTWQMQPGGVVCQDCMRTPGASTFSVGTWAHVCLECKDAGECLTTHPFRAAAVLYGDGDE